MLRILLLLTMVSCAGIQPRYGFERTTPIQKHQKKVEACVHRFIDKGVLFFEASRECADKIYKEKRI